MATDVLVADDFSGNGTNKITLVNEILTGLKVLMQVLKLKKLLRK